MKSFSPVLYISGLEDGHMGVSAPENRRKYFAKIGINAKNVVDIVVRHTDKVKTATARDRGRFFEGFDSIITNEKNLTIGLTVADCVPIAVFDPATNSIGLIHAGWRGLENGIIGKTMEAMKTKLNVDSQKLIAYVGAHICWRHYEVKADVSDIFTDYKDALKKAGKREFLDLGVIARSQLNAAGIDVKNIQTDPRCTFEDKDLFSFRRDKTRERNLYLLTLTD